MTVVIDKVWVVTVTYGNRFPLLSQVIKRVLQIGVEKIVVVVNGPAQKTCQGLQKLKHSFPQRINEVYLERNEGSAKGFAEGIRYAHAYGAEFIWLLDDDNLPRLECLQSLKYAYAYLGNNPANILAGFRSTRQEQRMAACYGSQVTLVNNSFLGFHYKHIFKKVLKRLHKRPEKDSCYPVYPLVEVDYAPYGGLLFHRSWIDKIGLPNETLYLYGDDHEFTLRLRKAGAHIYLCAQAGIEDLELSWHLKEELPWFAPDSETERLYYTLRNRVWLEKHFAIDSVCVYTLNVVCYTVFQIMRALLRFHSLINLQRRLRLLFHAFQDGWHDNLGAKK